MENIRYLEAQAGHAYWTAWRSVQVAFPKADLLRVPDHWRSFGTRISPLTHSPRLAVNPANSILNYLYAVLESETRLAVAALGLDPGLGFLHFDSRTRDSLALDVLEPIRPKIDAYVLQWLREMRFEENGSSNNETATAVSWQPLLLDSLRRHLPGDALSRHWLSGLRTRYGEQPINLVAEPLQQHG
jgi:CRISPR-associated endonuclease Cas1